MGLPLFDKWRSWCYSIYKIILQRRLNYLSPSLLTLGAIIFLPHHGTKLQIIDIQDVQNIHKEIFFSVIVYNWRLLLFNSKILKSMQLKCRIKGQLWSHRNPLQPHQSTLVTHVFINMAVVGQRRRLSMSCPDVTGGNLGCWT